MYVVILLVGILQVLGGIAFFLGSKSAIHEILGSLTFGLGILGIALGVAIGDLVTIRRAAELSGFSRLDSRRGVACYG